MTMGGKASGPDPLRSLLEFTRERILARQGRRLQPIDVHDITCKIGECVVAGGVRRTAMISLSDLDDADLRDAVLRDAVLRGADLSKADLRGADLRDASLRGVDLTSAVFDGATKL